MATLKETLSNKFPALRDEVRGLVKEHGDKVISDVTVRQAYGGMRGVKGMVCDTSNVSPEKGLHIRGTSILELTDKLPEEILFLLLTGELPDEAALKDLQAQLSDKSDVPSYVWDVLKAMPEDSHPMCMFSTGILCMEKESAFRKRYDEGITKTEYWEPALEDFITLLARITGVAAGVYRIRFNKGTLIPANKDLDWGANFAHMLGIDDPTGEFANLIRLYLTLHSDHEGGNVSANTCHTVGSALSDLYYAVSAAMNGLAGPLHGLANQECLKFVLEAKEKFGGVPSEEDLKKFCWDTLNSGKVIPGYGHAVLRCPDPRFVAFNNFGKRVCADDDTFKLVDLMFSVVPDVLKEHGKAKNPWPNVDAHSGCLLHHFGLTEFPYYTVLFGVSRTIGIGSQLVINRALGTAITRPKSVGTDWIKENIVNK